MSEPTAGELGGLDPAGVLRGALGDASASWPAEGPVVWSPPDEAAVASWFPGFSEVTLIGRGGMGAVYAARQVSLDRRVALKLLPPELSRDPAAAKRFRREAHALARLSHPNIVAIHDFGETPDGAFFFVMEFVEGADLHRLIRDGRLALPQALDIVRQVCDALEFAHAQGFVHRDIKPANILVDPRGQVKVSDFGLAKLISEHGAPADDDLGPTMTGGLVGTPEYIAPEQRRGDRPVDHRADIYSLGVMLYEMLTGRVPCGAFEPPSRRAGTGEALDRVVMRAMQEEPGQRYQHAGDVKHDVTKAAEPDRFRAKWPAFVAALLLVGGAMAWAWWPSSEKTAPSATSSPFRNSLGLLLAPFGEPDRFLATTETRRQDFAAFVEATGHVSRGEIKVYRAGDWEPQEGSWREPPGVPPQMDAHPVVAVTAPDAEAFCAWLTQRERGQGRIGPRDRYRLPTAEEWDRAAALANDEPAAPRSDGPHPIPPPTDAAFRDLSGNVLEWTATPGRRPNERLARGADWTRSWPLDHEHSYPRDLRGIALGFRILLERTPKSQAVHPVHPSPSP